MKKRILGPFLAGAICFAVIYGFFWLLATLIEKSFDRDFGRSDLIVQGEAISPNQHYVATTYVDSGGGAAGWCARVVAIRKTDQQFNPDQNRVFNIQCDSKVEVAWTNDSNLLIKFASAADSVSVSQQSLSVDKAVKISYAADTPGVKESRP